MASLRMRSCYCAELSEQSSAIPAMTRLSYHGWWSTPDASCPGARKVVTERRHFKDCTAKNQISVRSLAWDAKQQRRMFHWECRWCVQSSRNPRTGASGQMGHRSHQQRVWSSVEDDGWKVDRGQTRGSSGRHSKPSVAVRGSTNPEGENHHARH